LSNTGDQSVNRRDCRVREPATPAKAGATPWRSVVFEDAPVGIQAAKAAGMYAVGLTTTHPADALAEAGDDEVVATLSGYNVDRLLARLTARSDCW
jgi:hypothetical protein